MRIFMKKNFILIVTLTFGSVFPVISAENIPESAGSSLGLPTTEPTVRKPAIRSEIESVWEGGKKNKARRMLDAWQGKDKKSPWPWVTEAALEFSDNRYKKTLSLGQAALKRHPSCGEAYYWRGRAFEKMGKLLEAANEYRAAELAEIPYKDARSDLERVLNSLDPSRLSGHPGASKDSDVN